MAGFPRGLYEVLITDAIATRLQGLDGHLREKRDQIRPVEAGDRIALHISQIVERAISAVKDEDRVTVGVALIRRFIDQIDQLIAGAESASYALIEPGSVLRKVLGRLPDGTLEEIPEPLIPLLDTALLTNAPGEPRVGHQILAEIHSADRIDAVIAFIRRTGIAPFLGALRTHCAAGRELRVLTTTYTGSTEARALDILAELGADIRVSYESNATRLHAKAWLFHRESGFATAYVGSSNLTYSAQVSGLEWNVRVSGARNPDVVTKIGAVFDSYWNSVDFTPYDRVQFLECSAHGLSSGPTVMLSPVELRPEPFQERLLEQIVVSREQGHHRNLLVSATGTGKTVMAALDYSRLRKSLPRSRLLFVAHREEILDQSIATFRHCLRDHAFGELWVRGKRPRRFEHVFASVQSIAAAGLRDLDPKHFDIVIVDEFHHAAAPSYRALLDHVDPIELLGLTATPERSDGLPLLHWFGNRIAAELRLWDAIDQHKLVPFVYYGVHDGMDLREIPWQRGRGYDVEALSNLLTTNHVWARKVLSELVTRVDDLHRIRAFGYCVDIAHARFMARVFSEAGVAATAVWGDSPDSERRKALADLAEGRVNVVFSVDLFNEGIDVPQVDTLLMLRPTDSPVLFLQQLGRGLRCFPGKHSCTVLDFVGLHRTEFRFDRRLRALLGGSRRSVELQVSQGFPFLPAGCHMELDPVAASIVLSNLRQGTPARWTAKLQELRALTSSLGDIPLSTFLHETGLDVSDVYAGGKSWSDLQDEANVSTTIVGPQERVLRRACGRLLHVDDKERLDAYRNILASTAPPPIGAMSQRQRRLARMLVASVVANSLDRVSSIEAGFALLWRHSRVREELLELIDVLEARIDHAHGPLSSHPDVPLQVHARYTRIEILAAAGIGDSLKVPPWQTGVYWARDLATDLLAFTLDKTSGQFSPTTRYRDYAISRDLIHWESQSVTRAESETGRRYRRHRQSGTFVFLFARLRADDRAFWFLGPATYVCHRAEMPMQVTWRLEHPLPGDLFTAFAAAVA